MDLIFLLFAVTILEAIKYYDPKGCGIPIREWLLVFFVLYFTRSSYQLLKIWVIRNLNSFKFIYDCCAFILANGSMAVCLYYGYDMYFSTQNNCDKIDSTAFLDSLMFVILFIGYFLIFLYLTLLITFPCMYLAITN